MVPFPMILNDPNPHFKVTPLFDAEYLWDLARCEKNSSKMFATVFCGGCYVEDGMKK